MLIFPSFLLYLLIPFYSLSIVKLILFHTYPNQDLFICFLIKQNDGQQWGKSKCKTEATIYKTSNDVPGNTPQDTCHLRQALRIKRNGYKRPKVTWPAKQVLKHFYYQYWHDVTVFFRSYLSVQSGGEPWWNFLAQHLKGPILPFPQERRGKKKKKHQRRKRK